MSVKFIDRMSCAFIGQPFLSLFNKLNVTISIVCLLLITGCASSVKVVSKVAEVIYDPNVQVGSNETQPSKVSVAVLTERADTTVSPSAKHRYFSSGLATNHYLLKIYELDENVLGGENVSTLTANQVMAVMGGEYLEKHEYYVKLDGFRFIKHFSVDKKVANLLAVVYFEEPQCTLWSTLRGVKSIGEEYNFYLKATERRFLFRSELDVSSPGEKIKIDNRYIGVCGGQDNALLAKVQAPESRSKVLTLIRSHQEAVVSQSVVDDVQLLPKVEIKIKKSPSPVDVPKSPKIAASSSADPVAVKKPSKYWWYREKVVDVSPLSGGAIFKDAPANAVVKEYL